MRIDYRPPRTSTGTSFSSTKKRTAESARTTSIALIALLGCMFFMIGFGSGWYFSQQSTKRAFRAAMEQNSLESSPKEEQHPIPQPAPVQPVAPVAALPPAQPSETVQPAQPSATQTNQQTVLTQDKPLSFYENLPSGQKNTVLGSGINDKSKTPLAPTQTAQATKPQPKPETAPQTESAPPPSIAAPKAQPSSGGWLVQVAALSSQKDAEALKTRLLAKGYTASVMETHLNDKGTWYRVRIGRQMTKEAATDIANRIGGGAKALLDQE